MNNDEIIELTAHVLLIIENVSIIINYALKSIIETNYTLELN